MYSQIRTAVNYNSKILHMISRCVCHEMSVPYSSSSKFKFVYRNLKIKSRSGSDVGITSVNHENFKQTTLWQQNIMDNCCGGFMIRRYFHHSSEMYKKDDRPIPKLLYMQNPITWLVNKLEFGMLKRVWDPQFDESEFRRGTKQAVSTVTKFVSQNLFNSLQGLLTKNALIALQRDVETKWSDEQRRHIEVEPEDIQVAIPRRLHFQKIVEQKFCDVDMVFIALKWAEHGGSSAIIFVEIIARFHREYTEGCLPDWTVSLFRVTRFNILPR